MENPENNLAKATNHNYGLASDKRENLKVYIDTKAGTVRLKSSPNLPTRSDPKKNEFFKLRHVDKINYSREDLAYDYGKMIYSPVYTDQFL